MFSLLASTHLNNIFRTRDSFLSGNCWLAVLVLIFSGNHKMEVIIFVCLDTSLGHISSQACAVDTKSKLNVHGTFLWRLGRSGRLLTHSIVFPKIKPHDIQSRYLMFSVFSPNPGKYGPEKTAYGYFSRRVYHCIYTLTHFFLMFLFDTPLKTRENHWLSVVFRGYRMEISGRNGLILNKFLVLPNPIPSSLRHCLKIE